MFYVSWDGAASGFSKHIDLVGHPSSFTLPVWARNIVWSVIRKDDVKDHWKSVYVARPGLGKMMYKIIGVP